LTSPIGSRRACVCRWGVSARDTLAAALAGRAYGELRFAPKSCNGSKRVPGPYPYYGASGVIDHVADYIFDGEFLLVAEDGENLRTRKTPVAFLARGKFWVNNHAHVLRGSGAADTRYLAYALAEADVSGYLSGSTQPKLTRASLERLRLPTPRWISRQPSPHTGRARRQDRAEPADRLDGARARTRGLPGSLPH
jgi:hypothetical protein